jgi:hypothetical protein
VTDHTEDPWAWLHEQSARERAPWADVVVTAYLTAAEPEARATVRALVEACEVEPDEVRDGPPPADAPDEWLWLLPGGAAPAPDALRQLLTALHRQPDLDVVGPLLVAPRRRGPGTVISQFGQTITAAGRLRPLVEPGELYQGQLEGSYALGVDTLGMLVRGEVWRELDGLDAHLPDSFQGIEFGWRAVLAGHLVAVEPAAQLIDRRPASDEADARAAGLALVVAHTRRGWRWLRSLGLALGAVFAWLGFLLGKDPLRAGEEWRGLLHWLGNRPLRRSVRLRAAAVPGTPRTRARVRGLRPTFGDALHRAREAVVDRFSGWLDTFAGRSDGAGLDELTGDDFAARGRPEPRLSALVTGLVGTLVLAGIAARQLYGTGSLQGRLLLAAPAGWLDLLHSYLDVVPGSAGLSGAPWAGLAGLASFVTGGQPEWLVGLIVIGSAPLAWLFAFRLLRQLVSSPALAGVAAFCYALAPALVGVLNLGSFGAVAWTVLLPVAGYSLREWLRVGSWRSASTVALWALLGSALVPLAWAVVVVGCLVLAVSRRSLAAAGQGLLVAAAPALLLAGPWTATLLAYPGRLLTGTEPSLATTAEASPWQVLLARSAAGGTPPLWLSAVVVGAFWLVALAAALRRPGRAGAALVAAALLGAGVVWLTRLVLWVPPGEWARPLGLEWLVGMLGALVLAGAIGLDGAAAELRDSSLGLRHAGTLALAGVVAVAVALGGGWWVLAGQTGLHRAAVGELPPFVHNLQTSATPGRTLAIAVRESKVTWSLLQDDYPRLGQVERGLVLSGDPAATTLATSVVGRLMSGSADDDLLGDLRALGVSALWLSGGDPAQQTAISNTPGLELGTGDDGTMVWLVPASVRAVVVSGEARTPVGTGVEIAGGDTLVLAEPADPRWWASVAGVPQQAVAGFPDEPLAGQRFALSGGGRLEFGLRPVEPWWAWVQLGGLALLLLLAAPGLRRGPAETGRAGSGRGGTGARRAAGGHS